MNDNGFSRGHFQPSPVGGTGWLENGVVGRGRGNAPAIYRPTMTEELIFPFEIASDASGRRDYSGNHIYVLNGYLPDRLGSSTSNMGAVLAWERFFDSPTPNSRFRIGGGFHVYRAEGFQTFYIRHAPLGFAPATAWNFAQANQFCTPLYLYVTNDVELVLSDTHGRLERSYTYGFAGAEPAAVTAATCIFTGSARRVKRFVHVMTEATLLSAVQIAITSNSLFTSIVEANLAPPPLTAWAQSVEIQTAMPVSNVTVSIIGGNAATLGGRLAVIYEERSLS